MRSSLLVWSLFDHWPTSVGTASGPIKSSTYAVRRSCLASPSLALWLFTYALSFVASSSSHRRRQRLYQRYSAHLELPPPPSHVLLLGSRIIIALGATTRRYRMTQHSTFNCQPVHVLLHRVLILPPYKRREVGSGKKNPGSQGNK